MCAMRERGGGGRGHAGENNLLGVCPQNYYGAKFISPSLGLIPGFSPVTGPAGDWGGKLHISCGSMTS